MANKECAQSAMPVLPNHDRRRHETDNKHVSRRALERSTNKTVKPGVKPGAKRMNCSGGGDPGEIEPAEQVQSFRVSNLPNRALEISGAYKTSVKPLDCACDGPRQRMIFVSA